MICLALINMNDSLPDLYPTVTTSDHALLLLGIKSDLPQAEQVQCISVFCPLVWRLLPPLAA